MEHPDYRRLRHTAERMIDLVAAGDDESFSLLWNSLTVHDHRVIAAAMMRTVAELRRDNLVPFEESPRLSFGRRRHSR
jgi:hypothetical protein